MSETESCICTILKVYYMCRLGHTHYIVWSTSSDKGVLYLVGGKKIKIKILILILVGGKNKKIVGKLLFLWTIYY